MTSSITVNGDGIKWLDNTGSENVTLTNGTIKWEFLTLHLFNKKKLKAHRNMITIQVKKWDNLKKAS